MRLGVLDIGSNTVHLLIVDAHHGAIRAENRLDAEGEVKGARFIVKLPVD